MCEHVKLSAYGYHWRKVTRPAILRRAGGVFDELGRYQGGARCVRCGVPDIFPLSIWQRSTLDCAHLDGDPTNDAEENTAALCRACHRSLDMPSWAKKYGEFVIRRREERQAGKDAARPILAMLRNAAEAGDIPESPGGTPCRA